MVNKKNKILIVSDYFYPHWTGISKSLYYLIQTKIDCIQFDVLTTKYKKELRNQEKIFQTTIYREPYIISFSRVKYSISTIFKFIILIRNYDAVLVNSPYSNILPISLLTKAFNKKLFIFHQGDLILPKGIANKILEKIFDASSFIAFLISNKISTYTKDYAINSRVIKPFMNKFTPLLMPVFINKQRVNKNNAVYKKLIKLKRRGKIIFGFAGRFVEEKGFDILFKAIPKVIEKIPQAYFVFAGETKMGYEKTFENLQSQISILKPHLVFLGLLDNNQLVNFYKMIDFIVIPSRSDCFNLVQAEAMFFGKPSIVSNIAGASYLVKESGFGLTFEKENFDDLAQKLIQAVEIKEKLSKNYSQLLKILDYKRNVKEAEKYFKE